LAEPGQEEAKYILKTHNPILIPPGVASTIQSIVEEADKEFCVPRERRRRKKLRNYPTPASQALRGRDT